MLPFATISTSRYGRNGDRLEFRVTDNGPGVPEELVDNLFRAFTGAKHKGVGLGLAISRSIAQNHGGDLRLEQAADGRGASFLLSLPIPREIKTAFFFFLRLLIKSLLLIETLKSL